MLTKIRHSMVVELTRLPDGTNHLLLIFASIRRAQAASLATIYVASPLFFKHVATCFIVVLIHEAESRG